MAYGVLLVEGGRRIVKELPSGQDPEVFAEEHKAHYEGSFATKEEAETRRIKLNEQDAPRWDS